VVSQEDEQPCHPDRFEVEKVLHAQDAEFYRYQDKQRWSRFQTTMVLEGAWLLALFQTKVQLNSVELTACGVFGFLIIFIPCLLSLKDEIDANRHLNRLGHIEDQWARECGMERFGESEERPTHKTIGDRVVGRIRGILPSGSTLTVTVVLGITLFNLLVLLRKANPAASIICLAVVAGLWGFMRVALRKKSEQEK
jgi:hypothetical protein